MLLGTLIDRLSKEAEAGDALAGLGDVVLYARAGAMGRHFDETPETYVAGSAARFAALASDEDWLAMMSVMERSDDVARSVLVRMLEWSLARDARELAEEERASGTETCGCSGG